MAQLNFPAQERLRWILKWILSIGLYYSGLVWLFRKINQWRGRPVFKILAFHGVSDRPNFIEMFMDVQKTEGILSVLKNRYRVITLDDAFEIKKSGQTLGEDTVVITLDDGYKDNYRELYPLLKKYQVPATIFLTTAPMDNNFPTFVEALLIAVEHTTQKEIDLSEYELGRYVLSDWAQKRKAILDIDSRAQYYSIEKREKFLSFVLTHLGFDRSDSIFKERMLSWEDVKNMDPALVQWGAHTVNHPVLAYPSDDEVDYEVKESKARIEKEIGQPMKFFAYPYGGEKHFNDTTVERVKKAGFEGAVTLFCGRKQQNSMYTVDRQMVSQSMTTNGWGGFSKSLFACEMSGIYDLLFARG